MSGSQSTGKHSLNSIVFSSWRKATKEVSVNSQGNQWSQSWRRKRRLWWCLAVTMPLAKLLRTLKSRQEQLTRADKSGLTRAADLWDDSVTDATVVPRWSSIQYSVCRHNANSKLAVIQQHTCTHSTVPFHHTALTEQHICTHSTLPFHHATLTEWHTCTHGTPPHTHSYSGSIVPNCSDHLLLLSEAYWHCPHSMQNRVYVTVQCLSVCLSVCPSMGPQQQTNYCTTASVGSVSRSYQSIGARSALSSSGRWTRAVPYQRMYVGSWTQTCKYM